MKEFFTEVVYLSHFVVIMFVFYFFYLTLYCWLIHFSNVNHILGKLYTRAYRSSSSDVGQDKETP